MVVCKECNGTEFKKDKRGEVYCSKCGYIPYDPLSFNYIGLKQIKKEDGDTKLAPISKNRWLYED